MTRTTGARERKGAVVDHHVFDHEGPWTEDAYLALPADGRADGRVEVVDGTLLVGPAAAAARTRAVGAVQAAVEAALPEGLKVFGPLPVRLGEDCLLVPDLVVTGLAEPGEVIDAEAALLVVEVIGSDHGAVDRVVKPQLYARSQIPYALLFDHDAPSAVANMIISGRYHEYARATADAPLQIEEPFSLTLDLAALAPEEAAATPS